MNTQKHPFCGLPLLAAFFFVVIIFPAALYGQQTESTSPTGVPDDWTHHHVVFSDPGSVSQAAVRGKLDEWKQIIQAPRFKMQQAKRAMMQRDGQPPIFDFATLAARISQEQSLAARVGRPGGRPEPIRPVRNEGKWSMFMKGSGTPTSTAASITGTISAEPSTNGTLTITNGASQLVVTSSSSAPANCGTGGSPRAVNFTRSGTLNTNASNLAAAINTTNCGSFVGVTASNPSGSEITITASTAGAAGNSISVLTSKASNDFNVDDWSSQTPLVGGSPTYTPDIFPAKYSFSTSSTSGNCDSAGTPDFIVFPTGYTGIASTQPNIIAYDNLYTTSCTSPTPLVYWQFNTGGLVTTSPVLSIDGSQVAYVQLSGGAAQLVLLKWNKDSALQSPTEEATAAAYNTCSTKPCWYSITFASTVKFKGGTPGSTVASVPTDTYSSPFYDYFTDTLYVGEDNGYLHQFHPVFNGAPAEVGSPFPVQVAAAPLNSPVFDSNTSLAFVAGAVYESNSSAYYHSVTSTGTTNRYATGLSATGTDLHPMFYDGAVLDVTAKVLYTAVNDDGGGTPSAAVWQLPEALTSAVEAKIGEGADNLGTPIYAGDFDNSYITNSSGTASGNIYVCGRAAGSQEPALWKVNVNNTTLTPTEMEALTTAATQCSPVTEFKSGAIDYIYLSVQANNETTAPVSCPTGNGCLMSFNVTTALTGSTSPAKVSLETGGTSGIVIDNQSATAGNAQIYFFPLASATCVGNTSTGSGTGICADQLSQAGLN